MVIRSLLFFSVCLAVLGVPPVAASECHGPVGKNETLWPIALRLRPDPSISPQRMMLALLEANPEAFGHRNVNTLETGFTLCFGPEDLIGLDDDAAIAEVRRQNQEWKSGRMRAGAGSDDPVSGPSAPSGGGEADALRPAEIIAGFEPRLARIEGLITELESRPGSEGVERALARLEMRVARIEDQLQVLAAQVETAALTDEHEAMEPMPTPAPQSHEAMEPMPTPAPSEPRGNGADAHAGAVEPRGDGTDAHAGAVEPRGDGTDAHAGAAEPRGDGTDAHAGATDSRRADGADAHAPQIHEAMEPMPTPAPSEPRGDGTDAHPGAAEPRGDGTDAHPGAAEPRGDGTDAHPGAAESRGDGADAHPGADGRGCRRGGA